MIEAIVFAGFILASVAFFALFGLVGGAAACLLLFGVVTGIAKAGKRFIGHPLDAYDIERRSR